MTSNLRCPQCNQPLPENAREGLCAPCLLAGALEPSMPAESDQPNAIEQPPTEWAAAQPHWPTIARYRILRLIGEGGMGEVYAAEQQHPRREVALKVVRSGLSTQRNLQRFAYEAEALARLQHPGIAQVYESGTAQSGGGVVPFFAMELVRGADGQCAPTITRYAKDNQFGTRQRLELLAKVADAVHHAHQNGVIHRDLKPSNVLVDERGQPKVLDFGVARVTDSDVQAVTLQTDVGQIIGTLPYMSPEQAGGDPAQIDTRTDVYGLGAMAYELLVGRPPLEVMGSVLHEAVRVIQEEEPRTLSSIERSLRGDVETIVAKALAKEKQRRYASAAELAADIRHYLSHEPISARPASASYQLAKFARRNKALVGGTVSTFLMLVAGIVVAIWLAALARQSAITAGNRARDAKLAQALAEARFEHSSAFALRYVEYDDILGDLPGAGMARRRHSILTLDYLEGILKTNPNDENTKQRLLKEYYSLGITHECITGVAQRNATAALGYYRRGLAIADELAHRVPNDTRVQLFRARLISAIGRLERAANLPDESSNGKRVLELAETFDAAHPNDRTARRELAAALLEVGEIEHQHGATAAESQHLERARQILAALPKSLSPATALSATPDFIADVKAPPEAWRGAYAHGAGLHRAGRYIEAIPYYLRALQLHGDAIPEDFGEIRDCWYINIHICDCLTNAGRFVDAFQQLQMMRAAFQKLPEPHSSAIAAIEGYIPYGMGDLSQLSNDFQGAAQFYQIARDMFFRAAQADPADDKIRRQLTRCQGSLAATSITIGNTKNALQELHSALHRLGDWVAHHSGDTEAVRDLLSMQAYLGDAYRSRALENGRGVTADAVHCLDSWRRAREWYLSAWELANNLEESERPLPNDVHSPVTLSARLTACEQNIAALSQQLSKAGSTAPVIIDRFWCDYHLPSDPAGPRRWESIAPSVWQEKYDADEETTVNYDIVGPNKEAGQAGTLLRSKDGKKEALIPLSVAPGAQAYLKIRATGQTPWRTVGLIHLIE